MFIKLMDTVGSLSIKYTLFYKKLYNITVKTQN